MCSCLHFCATTSGECVQLTRSMAPTNSASPQKKPQAAKPSHPLGLGLDGITFGGTLKKAGGAKAIIQLSPGTAERNGIGSVLSHAASRAQKRCLITPNPGQIIPRKSCIISAIWYDKETPRTCGKLALGVSLSFTQERRLKPIVFRTVAAGGPYEQNESISQVLHILFFASSSAFTYF